MNYKQQYKKYKQKYINLKNQLGGFICNYESSYITCLVHGTSLDFLPEILHDKKLNPGIGEYIKLNGHDQILNKGVFTQAIFTCNQNKIIQPIECGKELILVFSKVLLTMRDDYYINNNWFGGMKYFPMTVTKRDKFKTYSKQQFLQFLEENNEQNCADAFAKNEIVFENQIDLHYLQEIWICSYSNRNILTNIKNSDGTYRRINQNKIIEPCELKKQINDLLLANGLENIPVKIISKIPIDNDKNCDQYQDKPNK